MYARRYPTFRSAAGIVIGLLIFALGQSSSSGQNFAPESIRLEVNVGHAKDILAVAVSADGKLALTGSVDRTGILWEIETGKQLRRLTGHEDTISAVAFSGDGRFVLTASYDGTARLWEASTGKLVRVFGERRSGGMIVAAAISRDGRFVATAGEDNTARIWDLRSGNQSFVLEHPSRVNAIAFSPDSTQLITGGDDKIGRVYSAITGKEDGAPLVGQTGPIRSLSISADGGRILTGSSGLAILWDARSRTAINRFTDMVGLFTYSSTISPDGKTVYAGGSLFDADTRLRFAAFSEIGYAAAITPDGAKLLAPYLDDLGITNLVSISDLQRPTARRPRKVFVYEIKSRKALTPLTGRADGINEIAVSPNSRSFFTASFGRTSTLWSLDTGQNFPASIDGQGPYDMFSAAFSNDGRWLLTKQDGDLVVRDGVDARVIAKYENPLGWNKDVAVSPDNTAVLAKTNNATIVSLSARTHREEWSFLPDWKKALGDSTPHTEQSYRENYITTFAASPDWKLIAIASRGRVGVWDLPITPDSRPRFVLPITYVQSLGFSPDGRTLFTASGRDIDFMARDEANDTDTNTVELWNSANGTRIESLGEDRTSRNKSTGYRTAAISPDQKFIAAGSFDGNIYLRNNETKSVRKLEGHTGVVNSVRFLKDANGRLLLLSGGADSTTRIWNVAQAEELCRIVTFADGSWTVVESRTGRYDAPNSGDIENIYWVYGTERIALSQLKDVFYTPNLLSRLLGYSKEPLREVPALSRVRLHPEIVERRFDEPNARLTVRLRNRGGGIGPVRVMVDGKLATEDARDDRLRANPQVAEAVVTFDLAGSAGFDPTLDNAIDVIASNYDPSTGKGYIAGRAEKFSSGKKSDRPTKPPKLFGIIAGISDYNGERIDLRFAAKDAEDFAHALGIGARRLFCPKENPNCPDRVKLTILSTSQKSENLLPTKTNIKAAFERAASEAGPDDVLVVYLAGHGTSLHLGGSDTYLYLTQVAETASKEVLQIKEYREAAAISSDELVAWMTQQQWVAGKKGIQARNQVMILDTCAAGAFERNIPIQRSRELSADQITALDKLKDRTGMQILMGSAADAVSYEASPYGQGLMTFALLQGIKGAALKMNRIETQELFNYAVNEVPKMASNIGGIQKPRVFGSTSIPIGLMEDSDKAAIKLETVKPIVLRPSLTMTGETGGDILGLTAVFRKLLERASEARPRGSGQDGALVVYVDDDGFPGGMVVTGTYATDGKGRITLQPFVWKDRKIIQRLDPIAGNDAEDVTKQLLDAVLKLLESGK